MKRRRLILAAIVLGIGTCAAVVLRPRMSEAEVLRLAEPALAAEYPESFPRYRPYFAEFDWTTGVWLVRGTFPRTAFGGTPYADVSDREARILRVYHGQ
jgi:hypothetical protein